jgi:hypothetical protein
MPSESFKPEFHQIDKFNYDLAFVNSDVEMNDLTSRVQKNDEAVKVSEG